MAYDIRSDPKCGELMHTDNGVRIVSLYSGSKGNCTYISIDGVEMLIDAGGSFKTLKTALEAIGTSISNISHIFITHEHVDHVGALNVMLKRFSPFVHIQKSSAYSLYLKSPILEGRLTEHTPIYSVDFGSFSVSSFVLSHDSSGCLGYVVQRNGEKLFGSMTDTGYVSDEMKNNIFGCKYVMCEANHDVDMLLYGPYPPIVKERILSRFGHLSNYECASLVRELIERGSERILLAHLSEENNTPDMAIEAVNSAVDVSDRERIYVASQRQSTVLV